jgi:hypothetical protein
LRVGFAIGIFAVQQTALMDGDQDGQSERRAFDPPMDIRDIVTTRKPIAPEAGGAQPSAS